MKIVKILVCVMTLLLIFTYPVLAEESKIKDEIEISGADTLYDDLSDDIKDNLADIGLDSLDPDKMLNLDFSDLIGIVMRSLRDKMFTPIKIFAIIAGIMIINSLFEAFKETLSEQSSASKMISIISILSAFAVIAVPITDIVGRCVETIRHCGNFMLAFIPVFGSVLTMSGKAVTAGVYSSFMLFAVEMIAQFIIAFLLPLITVYLSLSICGAASSTVNLSGMAETVKKTVMWSIGILLTIFVGFMSFQSIIANSTDTIGVRTAKYIIGSSVPIVGGAMSEAFNTLSGCMGLLKSTVGIFGIIVSIIIFLPIILESALIMISLNLASFFGDMLGDSGVVKLTKSTASAMAILLGIILLVLMMCIVSTTVILVVGAGGV